MKFVQAAVICVGLLYIADAYYFDQMYFRAVRHVPQATRIDVAR
jgi:hypothetical protein